MDQTLATNISTFETAAMPQESQRRAAAQHIGVDDSCSTGYGSTWIACSGFEAHLTPGLGISLTTPLPQATICIDMSVCISFRTMKWSSLMKLRIYANHGF